MPTSIYLLVVLLSSVYFTHQILYFVHMLQLNSYMNNRYLRWLSKSLGKVFGIKQFLPILTGLIILFLFQANTTASLIAWSLVTVFLYVFRNKQRQKKKLVYTMRVRRLLGTMLLLYLIIILIPIAFLELNGVTFFILALAHLLIFAIVLIANTLLLPFEKMVGRYYYNDARKRLKDHPNLTVIGITGSYGKTSTKHIVEKILSKKYNVLMTPGSYNTTLGVVITVRKSLNALTDIFIAEMGAKNIGDVKEICDLVKPDIGILTSIGPQHLETFKTIENVVEAKFELIDAINEGGTAVLNFDNEFIKGAADKHKKPAVEYIKYGYETDADITAKAIRFSGRGMAFTVTYKGQDYEFITKLLGRHNVSNILSGIAIGFKMGVDYKSIYAAVKEIPAIEHRLELRDRGTYTIIDDAFNSNPTGAKMALEVLDAIEGNQKIIITPGMIELGSMEYELNKVFGEDMAKVCDYIILVGEKQTKPIQDGLLNQNYPKEKLLIAKDIYHAFNILSQIVKDKDMVLIENDLPDNYNE